MLDRYIVVLRSKITIFESEKLESSQILSHISYKHSNTIC